jgi:hypothetical protein
LDNEAEEALYVRLKDTAAALWQSIDREEDSADVAENYWMAFLVTAYKNFSILPKDVLEKLNIHEIAVDMFPDYHLYKNKQDAVQSSLEFTRKIALIDLQEAEL